MNTYIYIYVYIYIHIPSYLVCSGSCVYVHVCISALVAGVK